MSVPTALTTPPTVEGQESVAPDAAESATARTVSEEVQTPGAETETTTTKQQQQPSTEQVTAALAPAPAPTPSGSA